MTDLEEILNNRSDYIADGMAKFTVDGIEYTGYSEYTFMWEKTFVENPERSTNGSMGNLNENNATFNTPHMTATYSIMTINDYRSIMKQLLAKNEFIVTCYDPIYDKMTTNKMYFATASTPKYYTSNSSNGTVELLGVQNYTVELIGTNNPID